VSSATNYTVVKVLLAALAIMAPAIYVSIMVWQRATKRRALAGTKSLPGTDETGRSGAVVLDQSASPEARTQ
jgi:hypothetical protein